MEFLPASAARRSGLAALDQIAPRLAEPRWREASIIVIARLSRLSTDRQARLPGVRCALPGGAFYAFPDITGTGFCARELQDRWLEELGVATIAGTSFGARGKGHVRLSYATSLDDIDEAMDRLGRWQQQHVPPPRRTA